MRNATELMVQYAAYHRDPRNIASHFVGIPLIVLAIGILLGRSTFILGGWSLTPAWLAWALSTGWYLSRGNLVLGLAVSLANGALLALARPLVGGSVEQWLSWGLGTFALGWIIQFVGHHYEGRKPAFIDDLVGLLVGPMFVTGEVLFALGWGRPMLAEIEHRVGPTVRREMPRPS